MKKNGEYTEGLHKDFMRFVSITLLLMSSTVLYAGDFELAGFSGNSKPFDAIPSKAGGIGFTASVFDDVNQNGKRDKGEGVRAGITVKLFDADGNEINVGPDGILGNEDDSPGGVLTNEKGSYSFFKITHDFYRIQVEPKQKNNG